jgi:hypothetical protein
MALPAVLWRTVDWETWKEATIREFQPSESDGDELNTLISFLPIISLIS